jgi:DNA replication and repair protein RecF
MAQFDFLKAISRATPLILLDDVFDKLDSFRVTQIIRLVSADHFGQIFITDTNLEHLRSILSGVEADYRLFGVADGKISPI